MQTNWPVLPQSGFISVSHWPKMVMSTLGSLTRSQEIPGIAPSRSMTCRANRFWLSTSPGQLTSRALSIQDSPSPICGGGRVKRVG